MSASMETKKRSYWKPVKGFFISSVPGENGGEPQEVKANYIDGVLSNIYIYDDPGKGKVGPSKKAILSLSDSDEIFKVVVRLGTVYSRILLDRIALVPHKAKVALKIWPGTEDENVSFGSVKVWDEDKADWELVGKSGLDKTVTVDELVALVEAHPANIKPDQQPTGGQQPATNVGQVAAADATSDADLLADLEKYDTK